MAIGISFLAFLLLAKHIVRNLSFLFLLYLEGLPVDSSINIFEQGKKNRKLFWVPAIAPMVCVILSTFLVYITHADKHGVQIVSALINFMIIFSF